jgi:hypothetical protein
MSQGLGQDRVVEENMRVEPVISRRFEPELNPWEYFLLRRTRAIPKVIAHRYVALKSPVIHDAKRVDIERIDLVHYGLARNLALGGTLCVQLFSRPLI